MHAVAEHLRARSQLLPFLHEAHEREGFLSPGSVARIATQLRLPVAEAWEFATSFPDFRLVPPSGDRAVCTGLSCVLNGAAPGPGEAPAGCRFRCYAAPAKGDDAPFPEEMLRLQGPLLAPEDEDMAGLERARRLGREASLALLEASGLRGRGGAYFPASRKWSGALSQGRPVALVVNAEEGEPGVFKDRAILCRRPHRFIEGIAIAEEVLQPEEVIVFINGEASAARASLEEALAKSAGGLNVTPRIVAGGGGYVLGEETALLNAIEGRKPTPRLRPPYPVEAGLWGMPTVINNVETITNLSLIFRHGSDAFRARGTEEAPGTKLLSLSGRIQRPGLYEVDLGSSLAAVLEAAGGPAEGEITAVLAGGPSGGFLAPAEFGRPLLPGLLHPTGAVTGSGGMFVLDSSSDIRSAVLAMAAFNADESCGKCTPCREGGQRARDMIAEGRLEGLEDLLEVMQFASICGLGQMAPGPIRSARHFWPELFP
jgi:NADH:ubiquinone oxidoreductase subunit F (NADH-binding)